MYRAGEIPPCFFVLAYASHRAMVASRLGSVASQWDTDRTDDHGKNPCRSVSISVPFLCDAVVLTTTVFLAQHIMTSRPQDLNKNGGPKAAVFVELS